jgi:hypothetical protein
LRPLRVQVHEFRDRYLLMPISVCGLRPCQTVEGSRGTSEAGEAVPVAAALGMSSEKTTVAAPGGRRQPLPVQVTNSTSSERKKVYLVWLCAREAP